MPWIPIDEQKPPSKTELWVILQYRGDNSREHAAGFLIGGVWKESHSLTPFKATQCKITHWQYPEPFPPR